jgi:MFS transporter, PHS family, inorganic phosphate transporter
MSKEGSVDWTRIPICGAGFFADSYDLYVINVVVDLMAQCGYIQPLSVTLKSTLKTMALIGNIVGQLGFGACADLIGRRTVFIITCSLVIIGAILSASVQNTTGSFGIYYQLCLWRFILGVGIGGEYPLSAIITNESSLPEDRARNLAAVFSMQGFGYVFCATVLVILTQSLGDDFDTQWRLALALGALPMILAFYFRWTMHETSWAQSKKSSAISDAETQEGPRSFYDDVQENLSFITKVVQRNKWSLLGTAGAWFILDIVFYANSLFSGQMTKLLGFSADDDGNGVRVIQYEALGALVLQSIALPGYWCAIAFLDKCGLRNIQLLGFSMTAFFFFFLVALQQATTSNSTGITVLFVLIYGLTFFFQNFGANTTTYIIPSIIFPTIERGTCHGISAASGKLGAILGTQVFLYLVYAFCPHDNCTTDDATDSQKVRGLQVRALIVIYLSINCF